MSSKTAQPVFAGSSNGCFSNSTAVLLGHRAERAKDRLAGKEKASFSRKEARYAYAHLSKNFKTGSGIDSIPSVVDGNNEFSGC